MNAVRAQAAKQAALIANSRMGRVTSYDPVTYACKVLILPDGDFPDAGDSGETGWLPVQTIWSGPGWGVFCPPTVGDQVFVAHVEGDAGSGQVVGRVYDASHLPLAVPSGEFWLVHASGSCFKFTNDDNVLINAAGNLNITVTGTATYTAAQHHFIGPVQMDNTLNVNDDITGSADVVASGISLDEHVHGGVTPGPSTTAGPEG